MRGWFDHLRQGACWLVAAGIELAFPPRCLYCHKEVDSGDPDLHLCAACLETLAPAVWHGCRHCGAQVLVGAEERGCWFCRGRRLRFDGVVALGSYHAGLSGAILRMKSPHHEALSVAMGRLLCERRGEQLASFKAEVVVPIPMFWTRRLKRGMNSPEVLARCAAKHLKIPLHYNVLAWRRRTLLQASLSPTQRLENVKDAFCVRKPEAIQNARVLLIDDVMTTGATCNEAAKALRQAGAAAVAVAVIARVQRRS